MDACILCKIHLAKRRKLYGTSNQQVLKSLKEFVVDLFGEEAIRIILPSSAALCLRCIRKLEQLQKVKQDLEQKEKDVRNEIKKIGEDNQLLVSTAENIQITPTRKRAASQGLSSSSKKRRKLSSEVCTPVQQTLNVMTASEDSPAVAVSDVCIVVDNYSIWHILSVFLV